MVCYMLGWAQSFGKTDLAQEIITRRNKLAKAISALDVAVYAAQTNDKKKGLSAEGLQEALAAVVKALDDVIVKMDCFDAGRWRSGACEILPLPENAGLGAGGRF